MSLLHEWFICMLLFEYKIFILHVRTLYCIFVIRLLNLCTEISALYYVFMQMRRYHRDDTRTIKSMNAEYYSEIKSYLSHPVVTDPNNDKRKCSYESNG